MKNNYTLKMLMTCLMFSVVCTLLNAQVRIVKVDPATNSVTLKNFGSQQPVDNYWFCAQISYGRIGLMTVTEGDLDLSNGEEVTVTSSVNLAAASDLGLFNSSSFGSDTAMQDFLQWNGSFPFPAGREDVAVTKGIWSAGDNVQVTPPYEYIGNGAQNGSAFWETLLGVNDFEISAFNVYPNPATSNLTLEFSQGLSDATIEVFNLLGKRVYNSVVDSESRDLDISDWSAGVYIIKISSGESSQVKRFVKQ
ncbi:T9SS type A sorting domain-containing protein [Ichthyenterobacterium sp. W332]|uniref:T9SS type A sorting domain-containing protein n=1 Tax=Microcosmobacter mediterraneus TaxID=3075607 RepID=A0ABU2YM68_9FLAO|nr:T9SS type A sorting domain-containing protein [Ichthyenterobacterium sp. W332]MDT0558163.1 T9SS type A sorting domain-containing protein [Ichthyenterobacterium sp. W332]